MFATAKVLDLGRVASAIPTRGDLSYFERTVAQRTLSFAHWTPMIAHQLNVSSSAIDSLWSAAPPSQFAVELSNKAHKPVLKRLDEILRSQAFNDLGLCQPVSQSLTLRISHDGSRLEENGDDICSRKKKEKVSSYRTG